MTKAPHEQSAEDVAAGLGTDSAWASARPRRRPVWSETGRTN